jgi:two-component system, OmpR family, copper resistance phosphate regulon response regulator CusR
MKLLLIEDEIKLALTLQKGLGGYGYAVDVAHDAPGGKNLALANVYDLIISDVILPGMTGIELLTQLRAAGVGGPVLLLTALGQLEDKIQGFEAGADDYLAKPFEFKELLMRVRALTRRKALEEKIAPEILRYAGLELRLAGRELYRDGRPIALTPREFALMEYFMRHPERIISKNEISEQVWDVHFDTRTNVIEVYVNFLRRKIESGFDKKLIHTLVRSGYILREH